MPTLQQSDITPESAELFGGAKPNPIGGTEADFVRAARAAVDASFGPSVEAQVAHPELPITPDLFGGAKEPVFAEVDFETRFAKLQVGISNLSAAGIASM